MEHYVGLDVSLKLTAICIVDHGCDRPWLCDARESKTRFTH
jgi:hypothetical protein